MKLQYSQILKWIIFTVSSVFIFALAVGWVSKPRLPEFTPYLEKAERYSVEIIRDEFGVPHIYGVTDADTSFGLAYAHAEDDFATIQDVVLATRGSIAAEKGINAAKTDFLVSLMGVKQAIKEGYDKLPEETRKIAQAYADGINLYAAKNPSKVSAYLLPVKGEDLVAGFTFKTPLFYGFDKIIADLWSGDLLQSGSRVALQMANHSELAFQWQQQESLPTGSQGIAIAPHRSEDGFTRLLVNSHQPLTGPVAWYEARLKSEEGLDIAGATFPGAPLIIHGHNKNIGWSNTVNKPDLVDIYQLKINPENNRQYWLDGTWKEFKVRKAPITVKLLGPIHWTVEREILIAEHGPVLETEQGHFALRWAGMGETRTLEFLYQLNKADGVNSFLKAFEMMAMPSINYVYADRDGNIGHLYNAMIPKRKVSANWHEILPGDDSQLIWQGYWSVDEIPHTANPQSGMVYNANNSPFNATDGEDEPDQAQFASSMGLEQQWTNRALRIEEQFSADLQVSASEFKQYKFDTKYSEKFDVVKKLQQFLSKPLPESLNRAPYADSFEHLKQWDLNTNKSNPNAALALLTLDDLLRYDNRDKDNFDMAASFQKATDTLISNHQTVAIPLGKINRHVRGEKSWAISGGPDVLRAVYGGPVDEKGKLNNRAGDSYVMFIQWDKMGQVSSESIHNYGSATLDKSSRHYDDQAELFVEHQLKPVRLDKEDLLQHMSQRYSPLD